MTALTNFCAKNSFCHRNFFIGIKENFKISDALLSNVKKSRFRLSSIASKQNGTSMDSIES